VVIWWGRSAGVKEGNDVDLNQLKTEVKRFCAMG
jgi:hypothetical protein